MKASSVPVGNLHLITLHVERSLYQWSGSQDLFGKRNLWGKFSIAYTLSLLQSLLNVVPLTSFLSLKQYLFGWLQERDILSFFLVCPRPFPFSLSLKIKSKKVPQTAKSRFWFALDKNITLQSLNTILWNQSYAETHKKKT